MRRNSITIKSRQDIAIMKDSGQILAELLQILESKVAPGVYGDELEEIAEAYVKNKNVIPSFKNYKIDRNIEPFPSIICFSVNDEIVHGFPFGKLIKEGDIVSIDCGVQYKGFHSDSAITVPAGEIDPKASELLKATQKSLYEGIKQVKNGCRVGDIGHAVQAYAEGQGFSVVRDLVGHGVGRSVHEAPEVPNYGEAGSGIKLCSGMVIAIEPMVNVGTYEIKVDEDNWTIRTQDGKLSAHFEHTIAVTDEGFEILTLRAGEKII
jgi:methionyl aminopeptidase